MEVYNKDGNEENRERKEKKGGEEEKERDIDIKGERATETIMTEIEKERGRVGERERMRMGEIHAQDRR